MQTNDALLTYREAAEVLRVSPSALRKRVAQKQVPCVRPFGFGGRVLFSRAELDRFIEAAKVPAEPSGRRA